MPIADCEKNVASARMMSLRAVGTADAVPPAKNSGAMPRGLQAGRVAWKQGLLAVRLGCGGFWGVGERSECGSGVSCEVDL